MSPFSLMTHSPSLYFRESIPSQTSRFALDGLLPVLAGHSLEPELLDEVGGAGAGVGVALLDEPPRVAVEDLHVGETFFSWSQWIPSQV